MTDESSTAENESTSGSSIGHVTSRDGTTIGFERSGSGSPLVLVHGTSADHTRWAPVMAAFEGGFTVYAVDRRGRGLSGDAPNYQMEREYEDIAAVVDAIPGPVDLLGHSYGALVAMEAALLSPSVRRLVLYEPPIPSGEPMYADGMRGRLEAILERGERELALTTFFREVVGMPEGELEVMRAAPSWRARVTAAHTVPREFANDDYGFEPSRFAGLRSPVLLLKGSESPAFLHAATALAESALPRNRVEVMEGQSHVAINMAPELFSSLVVSFLSELD